MMNFINQKPGKATRRFTLGAAALAITLGVAPAQAQEFEWTYIETTTANGSQWTPALLTKLEEMSDGRIDTKVLYYGQHPFKPQDTFDVIQNRSGDFGREYGVLVSGAEPKIAAIDLTFMFSEISEVQTLLTDPKYADIASEILYDIVGKYNGTVLGTWGHPDVALMSDTIVDSPTALEGKRIRTFGSQLPILIEELGGAPVSMPYGELSEALSRGIVDGWVAGYAGSVEGALFESGGQKVTLWQNSPVQAWIWVNNDAFSELPEDLQQVVTEWGVWAEDYMINYQNAWLGRVVLEGTSKYGVTISPLDPQLRAQLREAMKPAWANWAENVEGGADILAKLEAFHEEQSGN